MHHYEKIRKSIKYFADEQLAIHIKRYSKAGVKAMVQINRNIIDRWFDNYSSISMRRTINEKTVTHVPRLYENSKGMPYGKIVFKSYIDSSYYNDQQEIQDWNKRNDIGLSSDFLVEYVMSLQLFEGIIGLPENGTREIPEGTKIYGKGHLDDNRRWVNDNFIKREKPLIKYIGSDDEWNSWTNVVESLLE